MVTIVPFEPRHADGVRAVILPIQQVEFGIPVTLEAQPDLLRIPSVHQRGVGNFWVAEADGEVVGTVGLLDIGGHQAAVRKMFVRSGHRGPTHGVGRRLLDTLVGWCRTHAVRDVYLGTTRTFVAAHRFYEKHGFRPVAPSALPSSFPRMAVDDTFYHRAL